MQPETDVFLGGMITQIRPMNTKKARNGNTPLCPCRIEDLTGSVECVMWPDDYIQFQACSRKMRSVSSMPPWSATAMSLACKSESDPGAGQRERTNGLVLTLNLQPAHAGHA